MTTASEATDIEGVRITNPDKVLYPEQGITKRELAEYYALIAGWILPHVGDRPITLVRCPTGRQRKCFYQRHAGAGVPSQVKRVEISGFEQSGAYLYIADRQGLIALIQLGVLEIHPWNARVDRPDRPDHMILDLDPGEGVAFADVVAAAHEVREALTGTGLASFVKTTGGKGIHVVVPIARRHEWPEVKTFARSFAEKLAHDAPNRFLTPSRSRSGADASSSTICATIPPPRRWRPIRPARVSARLSRRRSTGTSSCRRSTLRPSPSGAFQAVSHGRGGIPGASSPAWTNACRRRAAEPHI